MTQEDPYRRLTHREREVLVLAAQGLRSVEIARKLSISPRTAEHHRSRIYEKLDLSGIAELVRYDLRAWNPPFGTPVHRSEPRSVRGDGAPANARATQKVSGD